MSRRSRFKQSAPLTERLSAFIQAMRERATLIPPGPERDEMLKKAERAEAAQKIDNWANSTGLQPPK
ncbi:hypothetical protein [Nitrobacter sp.]|uniref:hypothetical protein n=1 Tax=Nitrobacter sp. TaxID=29420 RepID=UPI003F649340